jgi:putative DNA primase/helicase
MTTAETITAALGGRWRVGRGGMAGCPCHDDRTPSLSIRDGYEGKVLVHCHAGCDQAHLIAVLRSRGLWLETLAIAMHATRQGKTDGAWR